MVFSEHVLPDLCKHTTKEKDVPQDEDFLVLWSLILTFALVTLSVSAVSAIHLYFSSKFLVHSALVICLYFALWVPLTHSVCFSQNFSLYFSSSFLLWFFFLTLPCLIQISQLSHLTKTDQLLTMLLSNGSLVNIQVDLPLAEDNPDMDFMVSLYKMTIYVYPFYSCFWILSAWQIEQEGRNHHNQWDFCW